MRRMKLNIVTLHFFLCLLRFGVERARLPNFRFYGGPGEGSCDQCSVGRELPTLCPTNVFNLAFNRTPHDRDRLGQGSLGVQGFFRVFET